MTGISVTAPPTGGAVYDPSLVEGQDGANPLSSLSGKQIEELQQKILQWLQTSQSQQPNGTPGVTDGNGAPEIDGVKINFSAEDLGDALRMLGTKNQEARLKTAKEGLESSKTKMAENHKANIAKIEEYAKKYAEAHSKSSSIFGWIAKAFAVIGAAIAVAVAAVATVATGGAAAPALVIAGICLAAATISLASAISQECGGPALELSSLMTKAISAVLQACGVPKEKAESIGKIASGALAIMATSGAALLLDPAFMTNIVAGSMELGGVDPQTIATVSMAVTITTTVVVGIAAAVMTMGAGSIGAATNAATSTASTAANVAGKAASIAQGATMVLAGGMQVGAGIETIKSAEAQHDADIILSDKKKLEALTAALMKAMEEDSEEIKKVLKEIEESVQSISAIIAGSAQSMSEIASNIGGGRRATV